MRQRAIAVVGRLRPALTPADQLQAAASTTIPGRWVGGVSAVLAPLLLLAGMVLRVRFDFFYPGQLRGYEQHPALMTWSTSLLTLGVLLLVPAVIAVASGIGVRAPGWALWGGILTVLGLGARLFFAGVDHLAFQLVDLEGYRTAHDVVDGAYPAFYVLATVNPANLVGWLVLAVGAWRARTFGGLQCAALGAMAFLVVGILKGTSDTSIPIGLALSAVLVPYGVQLLRTGPFPGGGRIAVGVGAVVVATAGLVLLGRAG
ncbi:hypothetical protein HQ32_03423 [Prauserella sp. Am3]|nr:hypothetical protein HQ32_03423 [Prauserella sp. Am3]